MDWIKYFILSKNDDGSICINQLRQAYHYYTYWKDTSIKGYIDNKLNKLSVVYHPNNQIKSLDEFDNGKQIGKEYQWYRNGNLSFTCEYINDKKHGTECSFYYDGSIQYIRNYNNGLLYGLQCDWDLGKRITNISNYRKKDGFSYTFIYNKNITIERIEYINYKDPSCNRTIHYGKMKE